LSSQFFSNIDQKYFFVKCYILSNSFFKPSRKWVLNIYFQIEQDLDFLKRLPHFNYRVYEPATKMFGIFFNGMEISIFHKIGDSVKLCFSENKSEIFIDKYHVMG
jgi:hypothetical protein